MKKNKGFTSLGSLISQYSKHIDLDRGLREVALKKIWNDIIDNVFKENTILLGIKTTAIGDVLLVSAKSSVVCQEFLIHKKNIINKVAVSAYSLGFDVKDISVSTKFWEEKKQSSVYNSNSSNYNVFIGNPTESELSELIIPESVLSGLKNAINEKVYPDKEIRDKLLNIAINDIKTQIWRKNKGFPSCKKCGITVNYFLSEGDILCPSCKFND